MTTQEPEPTEPKEWLQCLLDSTPPSEEPGNINLNLKTAVDTLCTIEILGSALLDFFQHQIPDPAMLTWIKAIQGAASDAHWYMIDEG